MTAEVFGEKEFRQKMAEASLRLKEQRKTGWLEPKGGGKLYYESYQSPQASGVIVMVHGFTESAEKYQELVWYFVQGGFQVYLLDMRGHGRSARDTGGDLSLVHIDRYETYLEDVEALAELAKAENPALPLYLYGHSMGGGVSAALLERRPELFGKAVLSSPMIKPLTGGIPFFAARLIAGLMICVGKGKSYVQGQHGFQDNETFEESAATCRERYEYYAEKRSGEALFQNSGASYSWLYQAAKLSSFVLRPENCGKIKADILLFQADQESFVDKEAQNLFAERTPKTKLVFLPGTKHEIYMSDSSTVNAYLQQILSFFRSSEEKE